MPSYLPPSPPPYVAPAAPSAGAAAAGSDYYQSTPWPLSPAARSAQAADGAAPDAAQASAQHSRRGTAAAQSRRRGEPAAQQTAEAPRYAQPYQPYGATAPYPPQPVYPPLPQQQQGYAATPPAYAPQQGYYAAPAQPYQQPYQQPYPPQPYQPYQAAYGAQPQPAYAAPQQYGQNYVPAPPAYAPPQPYVPAPPSGYAQQPAGAWSGETPSTASTQTLGVADELADVNRQRASTVSGGIVFHNRSGEDGLSNLNDIEAPVEGRIAAGNGHVTITATPVLLDAGTANPTASTYARFGGGVIGCAPATATARLNCPSFGSQTANGVGLSLGYETNAFEADVGTTPIGFPEKSILGGIKYDGGITDRVSYSLAVARRAVTDSLISYAGARDAAHDLEWGGVTSNSIGGSLGWDDGTSGLYVNAQAMYLSGDNVEHNFGYKAGGGIYTRLWHEANQTFTVGVNTTLMGYDRNQSYFTYGQGGYFSPQQYVLLNLPVEYTGRHGAFTWDLKGSLGMQHYRENAVPYFPLGALGSDVFPQADGSSSTMVYPAASRTGVSYSLAATTEYQLSSQLTVGAMATLGNAYEYNEWLGAVYVRYSFTPQGGKPQFPPTPATSPYLPASN